MANSHMIRYSTALIIRKMQIKTTMRYYFIHDVRMAKINNTRNNRCCQGCGRSGTLLHCWWECKLVQPMWKTVRKFLKKLKIELLYDPAIALLDIYPKNTRILIQKHTCTPMFTASTIVKLWKQPKCQRCGNIYTWNIT